MVVVHEALTFALPRSLSSLSVVHYPDFRGQLYMVSKSSQEETGKEAGEGIEIVKNHPYAVDDPVNKYNMGKGQYT
jgi:Phosphatidylinositol transfer protein